MPTKIEKIKNLRNKVIVTRHPALVEYLREIGLCDENTPVLKHVTKEEIENKNVIGILPLNLARYATHVIEIPLTLTEETRGRELTIEDMRKIVGEPEVYIVKNVELF